MKEHYACPECGTSMDGFAKKYFNLEEENQQLKTRIRKLEESLNYLNANIFVASSIRKKFHRPNCKYAEYVFGSENLIVFSSHEEAVAARKKPCGTCCA